MFGEDGPKAPSLKVMILLAASLSLGFVCNLLACLIWHNWIAIIVVVTYILAPIPNILCGRCGESDPFNPSGKNFKDMGYFLTAVLLVSGFALPSVLAHCNVIVVGALLLSLGGGVIVFASLIAYIHFFHKQDEYSI